MEPLDGGAGAPVDEKLVGAAEVGQMQLGVGGDGVGLIGVARGLVIF